MPRAIREREGESEGKRELWSEEGCIGTALGKTGNVLIAW